MGGETLPLGGADVGPVQASAIMDAKTVPIMPPIKATAKVRM